MKVFSEESALQLSEMLLQNDKDIKTEIEGKIPSVDGLATEKYVDSAVKNVKVDLTGYATETFVTNAIANAELGGGNTEVDLSGFATKDDLKGYASKEHAHNEYLTEHQDLSDYAKKTDIPSTDEFVTEDVLNTTLADYTKTEDINEYDDSVLIERISDVETALENKADASAIADLPTKEYVSDFVENNVEDGVSPIVEVSKVGKVTTVNITDINGTKTATINDGEDGNGIHVGSNEPEDDSITLWLDESEESEAEILINKPNKLYNAKILYCGDSICYGIGYKDGYAGIIAKNTNSDFVNYGVGEATLSSGTKMTDGVTDRYHICEHIQDMDNDADLICFEGGINDCWNTVPLGEIDTTSADRFTNELDTTTFAGALESIFRQSIEKWVGVPICFVIIHKAKNIEIQGFENYYNMIVKVCNKYSIPYCDLYLNSGFNCGITVLANNYTASADAVHPNKEGYERYYVPQIQSLFESIIVRKEV